MKVNIHPDKVVSISDGNTILYLDTIDNFETDYGSKLDPVQKNNMVGRLYEQGNFDRYYNEFTNVTFKVAWPQGDDIIARVGDIVSAKSVRINKQEPLTADEIAKQEAKTKVKTVNFSAINTLPELKAIVSDLIKVLM